MLSSFAVLFAVLIAVPGLLIPLHVCSRMYRVVTDDRRPAAERIFARGTMLVMLLLMGFSVYAALRTFTLLNALAGATS